MLNPSLSAVATRARGPVRTVRGDLAASIVAVALAALHATPAVAQTFDETTLPGIKIMEFNAGDLDDRTYGYGYVRGTEIPAFVCLAPEALSAAVYVHSAVEGSGWLRLAAERGWNGFAFDLVGGGKSMPPTTNDLIRLTDKALFGVSQSGLATQAVAVFAPGVAAAFVIKARALDPGAFRAAILLDPLGPAGAQSPTAVTADDLVQRRKQLNDRLWVEWALGPRPGKLAKGSDLGRDGCAKLLSWIEPNQPQFWVAATGGFDSVLEVREAGNLKDWPVLILRSPRRGAEQIERENQIAAWLRERGARVEQRPLTELGGEGISALPMCGRQAPVVLDALLAWATAAIPPDKAPAPAMTADQP